MLSGVYLGFTSLGLWRKGFLRTCSPNGSSNHGRSPEGAEKNKGIFAKCKGQHTNTHTHTHSAIAQKPDCWGWGAVKYFLGEGRGPEELLRTKLWPNPD